MLDEIREETSLDESSESQDRLGCVHHASSHALVSRWPSICVDTNSKRTHRKYIVNTFSKVRFGLLEQLTNYETELNKDSFVNPDTTLEGT